ncbi:MAG: alpha/beta fold hydrolase [Vicinamibacterales bacterium]
MTIYAWARRRTFPALPTPEALYFDVADDARVLAHAYWQPSPPAAGTLLALHGLEGSSSAHYMRGLADKAFRRGLNVVLLNQRNCGGTERLSKGLYHSGLTDDPAFVMRHLRAELGLDRFGVVGYSLGGNLTLKLTAEASISGDLPVVAACAVSPTMDLARCVDALERKSNLVYQLNFVRNLRSRMRRKAAFWPDEYDISVLKGVWTVRKFDDALTAPYHGFRDAADYYHRASALRVIDRIARPTLIISAANDPFVPPDQFRRSEVLGNPHVSTIVTPDGGHCAFVAEDTDDYDGYWAEEAAVRFVTARLAAAG